MPRLTFATGDAELSVTVVTAMCPPHHISPQCSTAMLMSVERWCKGGHHGKRRLSVRDTPHYVCDVHGPLGNRPHLETLNGYRGEMIRPLVLLWN
jgi:hypothetical protein